MEEGVEFVGIDGGTCMCPDGESYDVGVSGCINGRKMGNWQYGSLTLTGNGDWSQRKVTCNTELPNGQGKLSRPGKNTSLTCSKKILILIIK